MSARCCLVGDEPAGATGEHRQKIEFLERQLQWLSRERKIGPRRTRLSIWCLRSPISVFRGMTMKQIVAKNVEIKKPTIQDGTVNRYLSALGAFSDWLIRND